MRRVHSPALTPRGGDARQDIDVFAATVEDSILAKLEWRSSAKRSANSAMGAGLLGARGESLDHEYIERSLDELGVRDPREHARRQR